MNERAFLSMARLYKYNNAGAHQESNIGENSSVSPPPDQSNAGSEHFHNIFIGITDSQKRKRISQAELPDTEESYLIFIAALARERERESQKLWYDEYGKSLHLSTLY